MRTADISGDRKGREGVPLGLFKRVYIMLSRCVILGVRRRTQSGEHIFPRSGVAPLHNGSSRVLIASFRHNLCKAVRDNFTFHGASQKEFGGLTIRWFAQVVESKKNATHIRERNISSVLFYTIEFWIALT